MTLAARLSHLERLWPARDDERQPPPDADRIASLIAEGGPTADALADLLGLVRDRIAGEVIR